MTSEGKPRGLVYVENVQEGPAMFGKALDGVVAVGAPWMALVLATSPDLSAYLPARLQGWIYPPQAVRQRLAELSRGEVHAISTPPQAGP